MRRVAPIVLTTLALLALPSLGAVPGPDIGALVRPLVEDLNKPEFSQSRCMLAPLLANDKRTVAMSRDDTFHAGDRIIAINGEPLNATSDRALHDILIRYAPDATVTVRIQRGEPETDVTALCSDSQSYYSLLRAAATAAELEDAPTCADRMADAGKQHALGSTWLKVSLNCSVKAGRVSGPPMLAEYFFVFHEELLENEFSPDALQKVRPALQAAAQILLDAGSRPLAEKLQQEYASAVAKWAPLQGSVLALQLPAAPVASPRTGIIQAPPGVNITQSGKVTQVTIAGQLAAKHPVGCVPLAQVDTTRTPPDLYLGVADCIKQDNYRAAAALFALAGMESHFDAERVLDKSAGQAGQVLIMGTFNGLPDERREKFGRAVTELAADTTALAQECSSIRKMGYPTYYPEYMVLHGIHAFTAKPGDPTLEPKFDAAATWNSMLTTYLNCHDAPTAALSAANQKTPTRDDPRSNDATRMKPGLYQVKSNGGLPDRKKLSDDPVIMRMCFTQAMIDAANPVPDTTGDCESLKVQRSGNKTRRDFSCTTNGTTSAGRSDEWVDGNKRTSVIDVTTSGVKGSSTLHLETEMIFLGSDCNVAYPAPPTPIAVRHLRYEASVIGDGRTYRLNSEYQCRLEGDRAAAVTELQWQLRGGMNRLKLIGKLPDGSEFKILPIHLDWRPWDKNAGMCPDSTQTIDSEIWMRLVLSPPRMERFDRKHVRSDHHQLRLVESRLVLEKSDVVPPGETVDREPPYREDRPQYYQVRMTTVPAASVSDQKGLKEFTEQKRIPWLTKDQSYPFTAWSENDVTFARNYMGIFTDEDDRRGGPGTDAEGLKTYDAVPTGNEWHMERPGSDAASEWLLMPARQTTDQNAPPPNPETMTKTWIVYDGARIEIAQFNFYRVLYDPIRDEYAYFWINRVDAD
jgi:Protein of unknown function (DUF3617)